MCLHLLQHIPNFPGCVYIYCSIFQIFLDVSTFIAAYSKFSWMCLHLLQHIPNFPGCVYIYCSIFQIFPGCVHFYCGIFQLIPGCVYIILWHIPIFSWMCLHFIAAYSKFSWMCLHFIAAYSKCMKCRLFRSVYSHWDYIHLLFPLYYSSQQPTLKVFVGY